MQKIDKGGRSMAFRMDSQEQRSLVSDEVGEMLAFMGWEVGSKNDLEKLAAKLDAAGTPVHIGTALICIPLHNPFDFRCGHKAPFAQWSCHDV